jgi:hypothetical protein
MGSRAGDLDYCYVARDAAPLVDFVDPSAGNIVGHGDRAAFNAFAVQPIRRLAEV